MTRCPGTGRPVPPANGYKDFRCWFCSRPVRVTIDGRLMLHMAGRP